MKKIKFLFLIAITTFMVVSCKSQYTELGNGIFADIKTNKGDIIVKLHYKATPVTVANFITLAEGNNPFVTDSLKDKKYYDGIIFHRVIKDFMIQGGDPSGTGAGSPGYKFKDEFIDSLVHNKAGILSMANAGPKTNGSQFFITHKPTPHLNGRHTVFGEVVKGIEVVDTIAKTKTNAQDKPVDNVVMNSVIIVRNGKDAKKFDAVKTITNYFDEERQKEEAFKKVLADFVVKLSQHKEQATTLDSGLQIFYLFKSEGEKPKIGQQVMVNYAGYFEDGTLFDSNIEEIATQYKKFDPRRKKMGGYNPISMDYSPDARLIAGFKEGLMNMSVGDKVRLFIPPHLGYGTAGAPPVIPPNSSLIFDLEITEIAQ